MMITIVSLLHAAVLRAEENAHAPWAEIAPTSDQDAGMLDAPAEIAGRSDFAIARHPPRMTFSTMTGLPELTKETGGQWCSWGEGIVASNGKYYVGIGDHRGVDANCFLYEYDPATHRQRQVVDMARLIGQKPGDYGHGKLHGRLDEMPDGWLYFATYWGLHPNHLPPEKRNSIGGRLARYNVKTDTAEDLGMPLLGDSFPMHATDTRRGIFHGVGLLGGYLAWDIRKREAVYNGMLPGDMTWDGRCTMVDPKTGICWGSERSSRRITGYDPSANKFFHTNAEIPRHPVAGREERPYIRSYTRHRIMDGSFICQTYDGVVFKFFPDELRTEFIGLNWIDGYYSTSMAVSPHGRYVYYTIGAHGQTWQFGSPVIQMNTETYEKKVIAFLHPFYSEKYGYVFGGCYSCCLDETGSKLLMFWNGRFRSPETEGDSFGHPTFLVIEIPPEERPEPRPRYIQW